MSLHRRSLSILTAAGIVLGVALGLVSTPEAQVPAPSPALTGTWRLHGSVAQAQAQIDASVAAAISTLNPDMQRLARARIAESTAVPTAIEIQAQPELIHLALAGTDPRTFESAPGSPQNMYSRSGVRAQLTQTYRPDGGI
ncbi:MAG TPA: hypothetical protein ENK57_07940, partial [Polyangiaceae bacterium]|nr:hypothetical protein [Polyangiaceae bacterium]